MSTNTHALPVSHLIRRRRRQFLSCILWLPAAAALLFAGAAPAAAGDYRVYACATPDGRPAPLDGWYSQNTLAFSGPFNNCAAGEGFGVIMGSQVAAPGHWWGVNQHGSWGLGRQWTAEIVGIDLFRSVRIASGYAPDEQSAHPFSWIVNGSGQLLETCATLAGCAALGSITQPGHASNRYSVASPAQGVGLLAGCGGQAGSCSPGAISTPRAELRVYRATITLRDERLPRVTIDGGTAISQGALRGTRTLQLTGDDEAGSGVYEFVASIGGREVGRGVLNNNSGRCVDAGADASDRFEFMHITPCPSRVTGTLSIDTTKAPEGEHALEVRVFDAAGNTAIVQRTVTVDNIAPPAFTSPPILSAAVTDDLRPGDRIRTTVGNHSGVGVQHSVRWQRGEGTTWSDIADAKNTEYLLTRADVGLRVRAVVTLRNSEGSVQAESAASPIIKSGATIVGQTVDPGPEPAAPAPAPTNGAGGDAGSAQLVVDREQRSIEVKYLTKIVVTGRLVDGQGRPIADAEVDVFEQLVTAAAPWKKLATLRTDAQGGYAFRPATTASRRLRFAYAAQRGGADYRATRDVLVSVSAGMRARAQRRVVRPGGLLRLRGNVLLEGLPKAGSWVEIQVRDGDAWRTVGTRRVSSRGLWTFKHRLKRSRGVTFRFRALLRAAGDVPSAQAVSPTVKVRVR